MGADDFRFSVEVEVELADTDLGAVVYYGRYSRFVDVAAIAYRRQLGIPPLGPDGHLFVVRRYEMEYISSARFGDVVTVRLRTARLGRTSHELEAELSVGEGDDEQRMAAGRAVIVGVNGYGGRPSRVPDEVADPIRRFEGL